MQTKQLNTSQRTRYLVQLSLLMAVLFLLEFTGLGFIKTPFLEFTILQVPVILGAIVLGPAAGGILGAVFGLLSFWECFRGSPLGTPLLAISAFGTFVTCVPTRALMGLLCGYLFRGLSRLDRTAGKFYSFLAASLGGALLNTALFMGALILFFYQTDLIQGMVLSMGVTNPFTFLLAFVGVQGLLEALLCAGLGTVLSKALYPTFGRPAVSGT